MPPIRPLPPLAPPAPSAPARNPQALTAQRAFFAAALGKAAPASAAAPAAPPPAVAANTRAAEPLADHLPRPGSRLDIKV